MQSSIIFQVPDLVGLSLKFLSSILFSCRSVENFTEMFADAHACSSLVVLVLI